MATNSQSVDSAEQARFTQENIQAEDLIESGDLAGAARILVGIAEKDPLNHRAYNNMGIVAWIQKAWDDAYAMFSKSAALKPDYLDALMNLFDAGLKLKKVHEVLPAFEKALEVNPAIEEVKVLVEAIKEEGEHIYKSQRAMSVGIYNPILEEANKLLEDGKLYPAMEKFLQANEKTGPTAEAFNGLGVISYYQKRFQDAFTLFVESIKLNPSDPDTYLNLLDASIEIGHAKKAIEIYKLFENRYEALKSIADEFEKAQAGTYTPGNKGAMNG